MGPRRRGLRIARFRANTKPRSLRRSSSPNRTRFTGLRFGLQGIQRAPSKLNNVTYFSTPKSDLGIYSHVLGD